MSRDPQGAGTPPAGTPPERKRHTRWLYARVMLVQIIALIALYLLQAAYGSG